MRRWLPSTSARPALVERGLFLIAFVMIGGGANFAASTLLLDDARGLVRADANDLVTIHRSGGMAALRAELDERITGGNGDPNAVYGLVDGDGNALIGRLPGVSMSGASASISSAIVPWPAMMRGSS